MVLYILRRVRADVTLRLGNLQVVNGYGDGEHRFAHDWLRRNERDMATLAWEIAAERERLGFGTIVVLHQLGHPEKRKKPADYDEHERYNVKVDTLTHAITPDMPVYVSFRRTGRRQTQLWYEPLQQENVSHGTCHEEVTSDTYRHITRPAQWRVFIQRLLAHCGRFHATYERGVAGRPPSARCAADLSKLHNNHLATEARVAMWSGLTAGSVTCGCGHVLKWWQRADIGPLQWHFLQCTLAPEREMRRRWRAAIKRTVAAATADVIIVETAVACWTHRTDGTIHTPEADQASGLRPPTLMKRNDNGGLDFDASGVLPAFDPDWRNGTSTNVDAKEGGMDDDDDTPAIVTANGVYAYNCDWNDIEKSERPR